MSLQLRLDTMLARLFAGRELGAIKKTTLIAAENAPQHSGQRPPELRHERQ
jgi:hypothetical protein